MKLLYKIYFYIRKHLLPGGFIILMALSAHAQNVCNSSLAIQNGFDLSATEGCAPFKLQVTNKVAGATNLQYIYYYQGQSETQLNSLSPTADTDNTYLTPQSGHDETYTILQIGNRSNGTKFYSCGEVKVRKVKEVKFSYTLCSSNLTIDIPLDSSNNFDLYSIDWGLNTSIETIEAFQLPFSKSRNLSFPRTIKVEGIYNSGLSCGQPTSKNIREHNPTSNPGGYLDEYHPNISKIEMMDGLNGELSFTGGIGANGYTFYMTEAGKAYGPDEFKKNVAPGTFKFEIPDSTKSYCFYAIRNIACGIEQSAELCTVPVISATLDGFNNHLEWGQYKNRQFDFPNQTQYGRYQRQNQKIVKVEDGIESNISLSLNQLSLDELVDCSSDQQYRLENAVEGELFYYGFKGLSISAPVFVSRKAFEPEPLTDLYISVINQAEVITFADNSTWALDKEQFYIFDASSLVKLDSTSLSSSEFNFDFEGSKCYFIKFRDICGSLSKASPNVCSIELKNEGNVIFNNQANPFGVDEVDKFELYAINESNSSLELISTSIGESFEPPLEGFLNEAKFVVKAISKSGQESFSNEIQIPLKGEIYLPAAFSPNGDGFNDFLNIKGKFSNIQDFKMEVFDRWGKVVYNSNNPNEKWDGKFKNDFMPLGAYIYRLFYQNEKGESILKNGLLWILK